MSAAAKSKYSPGPNPRGPGGPDREALLAHAALDHGDGAGGDVVVVEARVLVVHPVDEPAETCVVAEQLLVAAAAGSWLTCWRQRSGSAASPATSARSSGR